MQAEDPRRWPTFVWLLVAALLPLVVYAPQLHATLDARQDDHRIVFAGSPTPIHDQVLAHVDDAGTPVRPDVEQQLRQDARAIGRFRPLGTALEVLTPRWLGVDALRWHLAIMAFTVLTAAALFALGRRLFGSAAVGAAFALFILLAPDPGPARVWFMMAVKAELLGTLLTSLALLVLTWRPSRGAWWGDALAWALAVCAALLKEPYILLLPAFALVRLWLHARTTGEPIRAGVAQLKVVLLAWGAAFAALGGCVAAVLALAPRDSYGHASLRAGGSLADGIQHTLGLLPAEAVWFAPLVLAIPSFARTAGGAERRDLGWVLLVAAAWWVPQLLLYATRGGMWDHYWLPGLMGVAGLNAAALAWIARHGSRGGRVLAAAAVALWILNGVRVNHAAAANFAERTRALDLAVQQVADAVPERGRVMLVGSQAVFSEFAQSWVLFLGLHGKPHVRVELYDTDAVGGTRTARLPYFPDAEALAPLRPGDVDAIVFLNEPAPADRTWREWFRAECFRRLAVTAPQRYFSLRGFRMTEDAYRVEFALGNAEAGRSCRP